MNYSARTFNPAENFKTALPGAADAKLRQIQIDADTLCSKLWDVQNRRTAGTPTQSELTITALSHLIEAAQRVQNMLKSQRR